MKPRLTPWATFYRRLTALHEGGNVPQSLKDANFALPRCGAEQVRSAAHHDLVKRLGECCRELDCTAKVCF